MILKVPGGLPGGQTVVNSLAQLQQQYAGSYDPSSNTFTATGPSAQNQAGVAAMTGGGGQYGGVGGGQVGATGAGMPAGYQQLTSDVLNQIKNTQQAAQQQITDQYTAAQGQAKQGAINSGLGNSTVLSSLSRGLTLDQQKAQIGLANSMAQLVGNYQSQIGLAGLGAQLGWAQFGQQAGQNAINNAWRMYDMQHGGGGAGGGMQAPSASAYAGANPGAGSRGIMPGGGGGAGGGGMGFMPPIPGGQAGIMAPTAMGGGGGVMGGGGGAYGMGGAYGGYMPTMGNPQTLNLGATSGGGGPLGVGDAMNLGSSLYNYGANMVGGVGNMLGTASGALGGASGIGTAYSAGPEVGTGEGFSTLSGDNLPNLEAGYEE